jgi:hypothetical protein
VTPEVGPVPSLRLNPCQKASLVTSSDSHFNQNYAEFCDRHVDAELACGRTLQVTDPNAASELWTRIDRELTMLAPWVVTRESIATDLVSPRTRKLHPLLALLRPRHHRRLPRPTLGPLTYVPPKPPPGRGLEARRSRQQA